MKKLNGTCLCKETTIEIENIDNRITSCHCSMCRTQAAGPIFYTQKIDQDHYTFPDSQYIARYASSEFAERAFCSKCGTFLFFYNTQTKQAAFNPELFPELINHAAFYKEIYYKDKPDYYTYKNETIKSM